MSVLSLIAFLSLQSILLHSALHDDADHPLSPSFSLAGNASSLPELSEQQKTKLKQLTLVSLALKIKVRQTGHVTVLVDFGAQDGLIANSILYSILCTRL